MPHGYLVWANTFYSPNFFPKINYALPDLQYSSPVGLREYRCESQILWISMKSFYRVGLQKCRYVLF